MSRQMIGREEPKPPANIEAEAALIGAILCENSVAAKLPHQLKPEHFFEPLHRRIFAQAIELISGGRIANPVTLKPFFDDDEAMKAVGGVGYLAQLTGSSAGIIGAKDFAKQIIELAGRRELIQSLEEQIAAARDVERHFAGEGGSTFDLADLADWSRTDAKPKEFVLPGYVPAREVTLLSGAGGASKSTFGQQLATCVAAGRPMLGIDVRAMSAIYVTCEDDFDRLHWMQRHLAVALDVELSSLVGHLHLASLRGRIGNELGVFDQAGRIQPTASFSALSATISATRAGLVILDNASHLFAGNENDRGQVTQFVNLLYSLVARTGCTIVLVGHGNKAGDSFSGSTAWLNAVRSQIVIARPDGSMDPDERVLTLGKANYARQGTELRFRWHNFALRLDDELPVDTRAEMAATMQANSDNDLFLACLSERTRQRRSVSEKPSKNYAPVVFATMPESRRIGKERLDAAMDRLFRIGRIERAELWRGDDRKTVFGLRETPNWGAGNAAGNGAETPCVNAGNDHGNH